MAKGKEKDDSAQAGSSALHNNMNTSSCVGDTPASIDVDNEEFRQALQLITHTNRSIFLTGKAGTGKSTFLRHIAATTRKKYVILAPTGIAAVNVGGQTIHSFFRVPLKPLLPDDPDFAVRRIRERLKYPGNLIKMIREIDMVIIDEISMVRADLIDFMDKVLRVYSGNMRQPFGGRQMLFVGDVFQLEPVVTGDARDALGRYYSGPYFFNASVFRYFPLITIELRKVYRQSDDEFISLLDRVRLGMPSPRDIESLNARVSPDAGDENISDDKDAGRQLTMTIATRRDTVDRINLRHLEALRTPENIYEGIIEGDFRKDSLPTEETLTLKVGAQVVFVKNDPMKRWVNGTLGVVEQCDPDTVKVRTEDDSLHTVEPVMWSNVKYFFNEKTKHVEEDVTGSFTQLPLKAAWALTIHKSQGLTFRNVIIDLGGGAFAGGQTYVALSRCRSLEGIRMRTPVSRRDVFVKRPILDFSRTFNDRRLVEEALRLSRADSLYAESAAAFDDGKTAEAVNKICEALSLRNESGNPSFMRLLRMKMRVVDRLLDENDRIRKENAILSGKLSALADEYAALGTECAEEDWESDAAMRNFDRALSLDPSNYSALMGKSRLLLAKGDCDGAYGYARRASEANTESTEPLVLLGDIDAGTDAAAAAEHYLHAESIDPDCLIALERLASLYESLGMAEEAEEYVTRIRNLKKRSRKRPPRRSN